MKRNEEAGKPKEY